MEKKIIDVALSRRRVLLGFGGSLAGLSMLQLLGCGGDDGTSSDDEGDASTGAGSADASTTQTTGIDASTSDASVVTSADSGVAWATGGTAAMLAKATYPVPFTDVPSSCAASCQLTEGPCYSSQSELKQDISYGYAGLPMRLYLRILDEDCNPVSGALVDVWHAGPTGIYSGNDSVNENVAFCTGNDADFTSHLYFRGKQTTDANGIVYFDSCYPGWYSSRTIHIHMTISIGDTAYVTTQYGFADTLDDEIVGSQPLYKDRGARDTTNSTDTVLPATGLSDYLFETAKMSDGAMLAWKTVILRSSLSETLCSPSGANANAGGGGGGGPGGGGPGGDGGMPPAMP